MNKIYSLVLLLFISLISCKKSEESKIEDVCITYMKGRIALESGDSLKLKPVTGDTLYKLMMLNHQYLVLLKSNLSPPDFNLFPEEVEIKGNKATCLMSGGEHYKLNLYKTKEDWKVNGENDKFPNSQSIIEAQKKIADYTLTLKGKSTKDSVVQIANRFFMDANNYFKNNDPKILKNNSDDDSAKFVELLFSYAKKRSGIKAINDEVNKPYSSSGEIMLEGDKATYQFYQENVSVLLQKTRNSYKVIGFNGMKSSYINQQIIEEQYIDLLRSVRLLSPKEYRNKDIR
ncbi:hypothetical protein OA88_06600 [Flavobacterium sp. JRM]|nr:hypothetical protein OA88_06600 [Flavobacterium sp. JRM]